MVCGSAAICPPAAGGGGGGNDPGALLAKRAPYIPEHLARSSSMACDASPP